MNFFQQGIPLGRWFGITVVVHWLFVIYAVLEISKSADPAFQSLYMFLLFSVVLVHEFGHALSCKAMGGTAVHIVLWPLGGIAFVQPPGNVWAWLVTTACGPLVNAILWPAFWLIMVFGMPVLAHHMDPDGRPFEIIFESCYLMMEINKILLLFNLIPAYPMDGGRLLQEILWLFIGYQKSLRIAGMVGVVAGAGFVVLGLGLQQVTIPIANVTLGKGVDIFLIAIGIMCAQQSWGIYLRSQEILSWRKN